MKDIKEKVALVTGAASGIGRALSIQLANAGANLVITDVNEKDLDGTARQIKLTGRDVLAFKADVSDKKEVRELCGRAIKKFKRVDIIVNNAGVALYADFADTDLSDWEWVMGVDFWGSVYTLHYLVPGMIDRRCGHIVNVSSWMGLLGQPGNSAYSAAKFAVMGLSEALRIELDRYNIGVTAVCPGVVRTNIFRDLKIRGYSSDIRKMPGFLGLTPEGISKRIIRAIRKNRSTVITGLGKFAYGLKRISPRASQLLGRGMEKGFSKFKTEV